MYNTLRKKGVCKMSITAKRKMFGLKMNEIEAYSEEIQNANAVEIGRLASELSSLEEEVSKLEKTKNELRSEIDKKSKLENEVKNILFNMHINNTKKVLDVIDTENKKIDSFNEANKELLESDNLLRRELIDFIQTTKTSINA
jgi:chromosome segregation ATPase